MTAFRVDFDGRRTVEAYHVSRAPATVPPIVTFHLPPETAMRETVALWAYRGRLWQTRGYRLYPCRQAIDNLGEVAP